MLRLIAPLLFLLAAGALVLSLIKFLQRDPANAGVAGNVVRPVEPVEPGKPAEAAEPAPAGAEQPQTAIVPFEAPQAAPAAPPPVSEPAPGIAALKVLETFLSASSLAERLPILETATPEAELTASVLAKPFPPRVSIETDVQETHRAQNAIDFFYVVHFEHEEGGTRPQTVLVRTRGNHPPRVVVDPFLDTFGGRLAAFAAEPQPKSRTFQVLVMPIAQCWDKGVPNPDRKLTLKLLARDGSDQEIGRAYFGRQSEIGLRLKEISYSSRLAYGQTQACTVVLHWNTEEDPDQPYLEALQIKALNWGL